MKQSSRLYLWCCKVSKGGVGFEADAKLKGLQKEVSANFDAFVDKFEAYWGVLQLLPKQQMRDILSGKGFYLACIPMFVREWTMKIQGPLMKPSESPEQRVKDGGRVAGSNWI
ncbi:hypothetical protein GOP47_0025161 [Adiantum capillus-veneris]|uniref:Uncharacterized protein n=1 Tax=Adiantum capillus-veneris TaxID=13818 RepID=A0A9D4U359_ADICA|nr:hypothetical protein GOP47_0025161 [Adiantum capillus-veneris]